MYPGHHAASDPDRIAHVMAMSGESVSYGELESRSRRLAQLWWAAGLRRGDHVAVHLKNHIRYPEVIWAAIRSGLYLTTINSHLVADEAAYIVNDSGARALVTSWDLRDIATDMIRQTREVTCALMVDGVADEFDSYEDAVAAFPPDRLAAEPLGDFMLYSSGTTGRPKGIWRPLPDLTLDDGDPVVEGLFRGVFGFDQNTVYLSPAPMYHSAPLGFTWATQSLGGTAVIMEHFDATEALAAIERYRVTHSQWVPTMFMRMLKLPDEERERFDLSSQIMAIHAAAPCPIQVKERMIDWWGPIIVEYYSGTEMNGFTLVNSEEWTAHPGTVGKPLVGTIHICDDEGRELAPGETGLIYFEQPELPFEYHNDPDKTRSASHPEHPTWSALGDLGHVDEDGYLYLTDRATFMIISGGVNIYPQEIENVLLMHPRVLDVAVIGVPNDDFGEEVKAIVQPVDMTEAGPQLVDELEAFSRERLAGYKRPRSFAFEAELPRSATGKLYKKELIARYGRSGPGA